MSCNGYKTKQEVISDLLSKNAPPPAPIAIGIEPGTYSLLNLAIISG
jgi:hypothetical protein